MQASLPPADTTELHAAFLQAVITLGLAALCGFIYRRYRKPYFAWWAGAWQGVVCAGLVESVGMEIGFILFASLGGGTELLYALAMFSLTAVWIAVAWSLLALPDVIVEDVVTEPTSGPLAA